MDKTVAETAREFLSGILSRMSIDAEIDVLEEDDRIVLDIRCDDVERIIGRRGQVVDALQHLVGKVSYRERNGTRSKPIVVDAGGYRSKHIERLEALAQRMADKALDTDDIVRLSPMNAHDRRIVHMTLAEVDGVSTRSEGEGEDRRVLIVPDDD
jgi:spoIIIJ-associated protein